MEIKNFGMIPEDVPELGFSLETMYKAIVDGIYYWYKGKIDFYKVDENHFLHFDFRGKRIILMCFQHRNLATVYHSVPLLGYGTCWALKKEELR